MDPVFDAGGLFLALWILPAEVDGELRGQQVGGSGDGYAAAFRFRVIEERGAWFPVQQQEGDIEFSRFHFRAEEGFVHLAAFVDEDVFEQALGHVDGGGQRDRARGLVEFHEAEAVAGAAERFDGLGGVAGGCLAGSGILGGGKGRHEDEDCGGERDHAGAYAAMERSAMTQPWALILEENVFMEAVRRRRLCVPVPCWHRRVGRGGL